MAPPAQEAADDGDWIENEALYSANSNEKLERPLSAAVRRRSPDSQPAIFSRRSGRGAGGAGRGGEGGGTGPPRLDAICLEIVGTFIRLYIQQVPDLMSWLSLEHKATLLAVARRRSDIDDLVLLALADTAFDVLDLCGIGSSVSDIVLCSTVSSMHSLQALDITGCTNITPHTIRRIAESCPRLQLLRLGGKPVHQAFVDALPHVLPRVSRVAEEHVQDSWEALDAHVPQQVHDTAPQPAQSGESSAVYGGTAAKCVDPCRDVTAGAAGADGLCGADDATGSNSRGSPNGRKAHSAHSRAPEPGCAAESMAAMRCGSAESSERAAAAAVFGIGRLSELRWLIWPGAPITLNPMPCAVSEAVARAGGARPRPHSDSGSAAPAGACGTAADITSTAAGGAAATGTDGGTTLTWDPLDPRCALDQPLVDLAGLTKWHETGHASGAVACSSTARSSGFSSAVVGIPSLSIAERFRQAYIDQDKRLREKERRAAEVLRRRQLRASPALRAMTAWLDSGPSAI